MPNIPNAGAGAAQFSESANRIAKEMLERMICAVDSNHSVTDDDISFRPGSEEKIGVVLSNPDKLELVKKSIESAINNDPIETEDKIGAEELLQVLKKLDPNFKPDSETNSTEKIQNRIDLQKKLFQKNTAYKLNRNLAALVSNSPMEKDSPSYLKTVDRSLTNILYTGNDKESFEKNLEIRRILDKGTPKEKRDLIMSRLEQLCNVPMDIDIHNDEELVNHLDTLLPISDYGAELINIFKTARELGVDFNDEKNKALLEKAAAIHSMSDIIRTRLDFMGSPLYPATDLSNFNKSLLGQPVYVDPKSKEVYRNSADAPEGAKLKKATEIWSLMDALNPDILVRHKSIVNAFSQVETGATLEQVSELDPIQDKTKSPATREEDFHKFFEKDTDSPFATFESPTVKINETTGQLEPLSAEEIALNQRKFNILQNVKQIKKLIPDFEFTEKDMADMLSPARDEMFNKVQAVVNDDNEKQQFVGNNIGSSNFLAQRFLHNMIPDEGAPNADKERKKIAALANAPTAEGHELRRAAIADAFNKVNDIAINAFNPNNKNNTLGQQLNYAVENYKIFSFMEDIGATYDHLTDGALLQFSESTENEFQNKKNLMEKVGLFGSGMLEPFKHPEELKDFPFEKLTPEQGMMLIALAGNSSSPLFKQSRAAASFFSAQAEKKEFFKGNNVPQNIDFNIDKENVVDAPDAELALFKDINQLGKNLATEYKKLKDADNFFNLNNSRAYKDMLKSLEQTGKVLKEIGDGSKMTAQQQQRLYSSLLAVNQSALTYRNEKAQLLREGQTFNANRQTRFDAAKNLLTITNTLVHNDGPNPQMNNDKKFKEFIKANNRITNKKTKEFNAHTKANADISVELIKKVKAMEANNSNVPQGTRFVYRKLLDARMALIENMVAKDFQPQAAKDCMAKMILCQNLIKENRIPENMDEAQFNAELANRNIGERKELQSEISASKVNVFLAKRGDELAADNIAVEQKQSIAANHLKEKATQFQLNKMHPGDKNMTVTQLAMTEMILSNANKLFNETKGAEMNPVAVKDCLANIAFAYAHFNAKNIPDKGEISFWKKEHSIGQGKEFSKKEVLDIILDDGKTFAKQYEQKNPQKAY